MQNESNKLEWNWHPKLPLDDWFGSFHNGTPESNIRIKERRRQINGNLG